MAKTYSDENPHAVAPLSGQTMIEKWFTPDKENGSSTFNPIRQESDRVYYEQALESLKKRLNTSNTNWYLNYKGLIFNEFLYIKTEGKIKKSRFVFYLRGDSTEINLFLSFLLAAFLEQSSYATYGEFVDAQWNAVYERFSLLDPTLLATIETTYYANIFHYSYTTVAHRKYLRALTPNKVRAVFANSGSSQLHSSKGRAFAKLKFVLEPPASVHVFLEMNDLGNKFSYLIAMKLASRPPQLGEKLSYGRILNRIANLDYAYPPTNEAAAVNQGWKTYYFPEILEFLETHVNAITFSAFQAILESLLINNITLKCSKADFIEVLHKLITTQTPENAVVILNSLANMDGKNTFLTKSEFLKAMENGSLLTAAGFDSELMMKLLKK